MEGLASLNEAEVSAAVQDAMELMLDAKVTSKDTASIKKDLEAKLQQVQDQYKGSLKEYLKKQYDKTWFSSILDLAVAPGSGLLNATGLSGDKTAMVKAREEAAEKAKEGGDEKPKEGADLLAGATLKAVALLALPTGKKLEVGMDTKIEPSTDNLVDTIYQSSMEVASKLFASATSGLKDLSDINFDFETVGDKISKNQEAIDLAREELETLEDSDKDRDWNKMIELYMMVNCLRAQQTALTAAKSEYEFLTGSFEQTFVGKAEGYVKALVEAAVAIFAAIICAKFISALGKTDFIADVKKAVADTAPTIIEGFQKKVNEVMAEINPLTRNPLFLGAVIAAYTIFQGGRLAEKLAFEQKEKYMILALEQFVPCITAVNSALAICNSTFKMLKDTINSESWSKAKTVYEAMYLELDDDGKKKHIEKIKDQTGKKIYYQVIADVEAADSPMNLAIQNMQVSQAIKDTLSPSIIRSSLERGKNGFSSFFSSIGIGADWMKDIVNIFALIEKPITDNFEDEFISNDVYTAYVTKENPTHAALGGMIFISQINAILKDPSSYTLPTGKYEPPKPIEMAVVRPPLEIAAPKIEPLPPIIDTTEPGIESCGVYVTIIDKDKKIYKNLLGRMFFETGGYAITDGEGTDKLSGLDIFKQLLNDFEFDYLVMGNADVTGPQDQQKGKRFVGNKTLSLQRAQTFLSAAKGPDGTQADALGYGKLFAKNYTKYIDSKLGTNQIAKKEGIGKDKMKDFKKELANDRRMEIIIIPKDGTFSKIVGDAGLHEKVCKSGEGDLKMILKYQGDDKRFFSKSRTEQVGLKFPERKSEKKEEGKKEEGKANESIRYIMSLNDFMKS
jgi:hypothetical protein